MLDTSRLKAFETSQAAGVNAFLALLRNAKPIELPGGFEIGTFQSRPLEPIETGLCVALKGKFGRIAVTIPEVAFDQLLDILLPGWRGESADALPREWQVLYIFDYLFNDSAIGQAEVSILPNGPGDLSAPVLTGTVVFMDQLIPIDFTVLVANPAKLQSTDRQIPKIDLDLPARLTLNAGARRVESAFIKKLECRDIVFFRDSNYDDGLLVKLRISKKIGWGGKLDPEGNQLHLTHSIGEEQDMKDNEYGEDESGAEEYSENEASDNHYEEETLAQETSAGTDADQPDLSSLPMDLDFRLHKLTLQLSEVSALGPGSVLDLGVDLDGPIGIEVNGRQIGSGNLIKVGDRIGVQISRWSSSKIQDKS